MESGRPTIEETQTDGEIEREREREPCRSRLNVRSLSGRWSANGLPIVIC